MTKGVVGGSAKLKAALESTLTAAHSLKTWFERGHLLLKETNSLLEAKMAALEQQNIELEETNKVFGKRLAALESTLTAAH